MGAEWCRDADFGCRGGAAGVRRASSSTPSEFSAAVDVRLLRRVGVPRLPCTSSRSSISLLSAVRRAAGGASPAR